jgi:hypothetical protein
MKKGKSELSGKIESPDFRCTGTDQMREGKRTKIRSLLAVAAFALFATASLPALAEDAATPKLPVDKNLKIWLTADAGITKDAAGKVSAWTSQVEPKVQLSQKDPNAQPASVNDVINGKGAIRFDGTQNYLVSSELPKDFAGDFTVFVVWTSAAEQKSLDSDGAYNRIVSAPAVKGSDYQNGIVVTTGSKAIAKPNIATGTSPARPQLKYLALGAMVWPDETASHNGTWMTGDIAEVLIYNAKLSSVDTAAVTKYLQDKYKITATPAK